MGTGLAYGLYRLYTRSVTYSAAAATIAACGAILVLSLLFTFIPLSHLRSSSREDTVGIEPMTSELLADSLTDSAIWAGLGCGLSITQTLRLYKYFCRRKVAVVLR